MHSNDDSPPRVTVDFEPIGRRTEINPGSTLLEAAKSAGVNLVSICGGVGTCDSCRVRLMNGKLTPPTSAEEDFLSKEEIAEGHRLGCQAKLLSSVKLDIPPTSLTTAQRLQVEGIGTVTDRDGPAIQIDLELDPPTRTDLRADTVRLQDALKQVGYPQVSFSVSVLESISERLRDHDWKIRCVIQDSEVVALLPIGSRIVGLAIDIGTTKLAGYLLDLVSGEPLASKGEMNPQVSFGEDVVSRIRYCNEHEEGRKELQREVISTLNIMINKLCADGGILTEQIVAAVMVGNTTMHHLAAGFPVRQLAEAPYVPAVRDSLDLKAGEIGLGINRGARVHFPANIAGFVGADHVAMILAIGLREEKRTVVALDIGTNTEITLAHDGRLICCSCASGPAFEGAHIRHGMRASPGAIERVKILDGKPNTYTVGDQPAVGICGSGILDSVAELYQSEIIDHRGSFHEGNLNVRKGKAGSHPEYVLVPASETGHGQDLVITRGDIHEIQLAKSAIRSGLEILLEEGGIRSEDIQEIIIAGAFGTYLDVHSAVTIGMLPRIPLDRFRQVGNAAGSGAQQILMSTEHRRRADELSMDIEYIELSNHPEFQQKFIDNLYF